MCGSRNFRACCYNYIKKRSIPWQSGGVDSEDESQDLKSNSVQSTTTVGSASPAKGNPLHMKHEPGTGKHIFRRYVVPEITNGDSFEDGELLYPLSLRDLMASVIRTLNVFENKKMARNVAF